MLYLVYRNILLMIMRSTILVGGQAVIEGVMMRVPGAYATAVRLSDHTIKYKRYSTCIYIYDCNYVLFNFSFTGYNFL